MNHINYQNREIQVDWQYFYRIKESHSNRIYKVFNQEQSSNDHFTEFIRVEDDLRLSNAENVEFWVREYDGINWENTKPISGFRKITTGAYYGDQYDKRQIKSLLIVLFFNNKKNVLLMRFKSFYTSIPKERLDITKLLSKSINFV
ncbi:hypothetical protein [Empedobacter tilapiae]|uniref:hypothetical protein n=1 Tax=Empedobacter tilapiae TaxID=2491114 RepID=UPI0028D85C08|nr:hypothetical protein [Empedobacter tilapiae]